MTAVGLEKVLISHFRTHKLSNMTFCEGPVVLYGPNGTGKTNILEAISLLSPGKGFRGAGVDELSRNPEQIGWKISADIMFDNNLRKLETWSDGKSPRKITIDGKKTSQIKLGELVRILWITPLMDRVWLDGASGRRKLLDRIVISFFPQHTEHILNYYKAMKQRNRLMKEQNLNERWYDALEAQMAVSGFEIDMYRRQTVDKLMNAQKHSRGSFPLARLDLCGFEFASAKDYESCLNNNRKKDFFFGRTSEGPHLSDLSAQYISKGTNARNCSTGEQKALLLSLILSTAKIQVEELNCSPILLLDEVAAHLDTGKRALLYDEICNLGIQAFLTGTDESLFSMLKGRAQFVQLKLESSISKYSLN